jgi:hypothetical protein
VNAGRTPGRLRSAPPRSLALASLVGTIVGQGLLALLIVVLPEGGGRAAASVLFLLGGPALAVYLPLRGKDMLSAVVIAGATAVVVNAVVAEVMVATGMWSITGGVVAIALITLLLAAIAYASAVIWPWPSSTGFARKDQSIVGNPSHFRPPIGHSRPVALPAAPHRTIRPTPEEAT